LSAKPNKEARDKVNAVAKVLRIEHLRSKRPSALAGGDLQRVTIGRALSYGACILTTIPRPSM
jgi:ABC-type sugar transport system ATPase subunit